MIIEEQLSKLYSDTPLADVFIAEYMPTLDGDCVKIYIFMHYLKNHGKKPSENEISIMLNIDLQKVKESIEILAEKGIVEKRDRHILLKDLKEIEISKLFRLKTTSTPEDAGHNVQKNSKRSDIISSINNRFFQGLMPMSWFTDIDLWFDIYKFDEEVMFALFQHCYDYKAVNNKNYVQKVASEWHEKGIGNYNQLEAYLHDYEIFKDIRTKIIKKLKLNRNLSEYEERYVFKWVLEYKYDFDIIEIALMKTTGKSSPSINYIDACLMSWHNKKLKTKEGILKDIEDFKKQRASSTGGAVPQKGNFEQRDLDEDYFNSLYVNPKK